MEVWITDQDLNDLDVVDQADVIWTTLYNGAGEFELCMPLTKRVLALAESGCFAYREDSDTVMVLEKVDIKTDLEAGDFLILSGRSAECLLERRIVWTQTNLDAATTDAALQILKENLFEPADSGRSISILRLGTVAPAQETIQRQLWGEGLLDSIVELLDTEKKGFRIRKEEKTLVLDIYQGTNRAEGNGAYPEVYFSNEYDNLLNSEHSTDAASYKNVVLVAGEGEGTATKVRQVGSVEGLERRELYLDKGSTSTNEETISEQEYNAVLDGEGRTALEENKKTEEFTGEVIPNGVFRYGKDYSLGDIVTIKTGYGDCQNVRIVGVTENEDANGSNLVLSYEKI